ncbi:hypothetical protein [Streptomyces daghestanicus]|uniref:Uncharacterized protein n=1 Tax=Streptomyces daghestanicus TaxID=66885 RepID=A0ABQ3PZJ9_9ACTN|nr:hypothetical protein [Streptomyces daghestanicus]GGU61740.1 hypothetical protein GCM10010259_60510 [Streptomyces daghestanicus]GHI30437.1 hypothetical protein Sdagh_21670 [Streptomyces daghestanicus]
MSEGPPAQGTWVDLVARPARTGRGTPATNGAAGPAPPDGPAASRTDRRPAATACFARSARHMAWSARELGRTGPAERYGRLADEVAEAVRNACGARTAA